MILRVSAGAWTCTWWTGGLVRWFRRRRQQRQRTVLTRGTAMAQHWLCFFIHCSLLVCLGTDCLLFFINLRWKEKPFLATNTRAMTTAVNSTSEDTTTTMRRQRFWGTRIAPAGALGPAWRSNEPPRQRSDDNHGNLGRKIACSKSGNGTKTNEGAVMC